MGLLNLLNLNIVLIGMLAGMLGTIALMAIILGAFVKVPGGVSARYWAIGSGMILVGMIGLVKKGESAEFLPGMLIIGMFLFGHVLQWTGLQIFYFKTPSKNIWWAPALFALAYAALLLADAGFLQRLAFAALVPLTVWPFCLFEVIKADHRPYKFPTRLAVVGLLLMILHSLLDLGAGLRYLATTAVAPVRLESDLIQTSLPILGSLMYMAALILLYFRRAAEQANYAATHDDLTGLLNRRAIIASGTHQIELARHQREALTIAFVDIDNFKKINDEHGHDAGDLVLREVAEVLGRVCRSADLVGRYGGEEFCLIFPGDHHAGAEIVGERIVKSVAAHPVPVVGVVTVSVGLAVLLVDEKTHDWYSLVQLADLELYKSKTNGRNQYSVHGKAAAKRQSRSSRDNASRDRNGSLFRMSF